MIPLSIPQVDENGTIESTRVLTLKQFVQVYSSIMQQLGGGGVGGNNNGASSTAIQQVHEVDEVEVERRGSELGWLEISTIFAK